MKKILLSFIALVCCMSMNAQFISVYKNGNLIKSFSSEDADSLVFTENVVRPNAKMIFNEGAELGLKFGDYSISFKYTNNSFVLTKMSDSRMDYTLMMQDGVKATKGTGNSATFIIENSATCKIMIDADAMTYSLSGLMASEASITSITLNGIEIIDMFKEVILPTPTDIFKDGTETVFTFDSEVVTLKCTDGNLEVVKVVNNGKDITATNLSDYKVTKGTGNTFTLVVVSEENGKFVLNADKLAYLWTGLQAGSCPLTSITINGTELLDQFTKQADPKDIFKVGSKVAISFGCDTAVFKYTSSGTFECVQFIYGGTDKTSDYKNSVYCVKGTGNSFIFAYYVTNARFIIDADKLTYSCSGNYLENLPLEGVTVNDTAVLGAFTEATTADAKDIFKEGSETTLTLRHFIITLKYTNSKFEVVKNVSDGLDGTSAFQGNITVTKGTDNSFSFVLGSYGELVVDADNLFYSFHATAYSDIFTSDFVSLIVNNTEVLNKFTAQ